jgi:DNA invertase Pin-like site-specific DNA recombinase
MTRPATNSTRRKGTVRCAIYSRKSSEEGLEQAFNSLQAQREACEAFITSQRHEGWACLPKAYDDGGFSGATTDRPALQRLLADIAAGRVDIVVVYKIDRLTRSLTDFAKIVEILDARGASFLSVTQQFNTTTSMGRLTLNILLSFAQFEREVIGERIRDKIAASKRKGMWMGGVPPLGYRVCDRRLLTSSRLLQRAFLGRLRRLNDDPAPMVRAGAREQSCRSPRHAAGGGRPCCVRRQSLRRLHKRRQSPGRWRAHAISELIYSPRGAHVYGRHSYLIAHEQDQ